MTVYMVPGVFGAGGQILDTNGKPAPGALINTYAAGTSSPIATFTTSSGNVTAANPIVCNADGRLPSEMWQTQSQAIKIILTDSLSNTLGTYDYLYGINDPQILSVSVLNISTANVVTLNVSTANLVTANITSLNVSTINAVTANISTANISSLNVTTGTITTLNVSTLNVAGQALTLGSGTWTPTVGGNATYNGQNGAYVKLGSLVYAFFNMDINVLGTGSTTAMSGLPYTSAAGNGQYGGAISKFAGINITAITLKPYMLASSTAVSFNSLSSASTGDSLISAIFKNSCSITGHILYLT